MLLLALLTACNVPKHYTSWTAQLATATQSSLAESFADVGGLTREDRVAIINLDGPSVEDEKVRAIVEDAMIQALVARQITVVERDSEGLRGVVQEGSTDRLTYQVTGYTPEEGGPMVTDAQLKQAAPTRYLVDGQSIIVVPPGTALMDRGDGAGDDVVRTNAPSMEHKVITASKVLEYRIIDVKLRDFTHKGKVYRFVDVVVHMRIVDTRFGTVVWAGTVQKVVEDVVPKLQAIKLRL